MNMISGGAYLGDAPYKPITRYRHFTAYHSSKAAQIQMTEYLSYQLAEENIQVDAMRPSGNNRALRKIRDRMEELGKIDF